MRPRGYDVEQRDDDREVIRCPRPPVCIAYQLKVVQNLLFLYLERLTGEESVADQRGNPDTWRWSWTRLAPMSAVGSACRVLPKLV